MPKPTNNRGITFGRKGEFDCAITDFDKAIQLKPDFAEAYNNRGLAYHLKGETECAIENWTKAIALKSDLADAYYYRGVVWAHLQQWEKARVDLTVAKIIGEDSIPSFQRDNRSIVDFEQKTDIQLPEDIAVLLTPPQA